MFHSMLRLDATTKKRYDGKLFKFKKNSIKQAFFINEIFPSRVKEPKQKKFEVFFHCFQFFAHTRKSQKFSRVSKNFYSCMSLYMRWPLRNFYTFHHLVDSYRNTISKWALGFKYGNFTLKLARGK
jgi:hypothetical protein